MQLSQGYKHTNMFLVKNNKASLKFRNCSDFFFKKKYRAHSNNSQKLHEGILHGPAGKGTGHQA